MASRRINKNQRGAISVNPRATGGVNADDVDPRTGVISNRRRFVSIPPDVGVPDRLTGDEDHGWVAVWGDWVRRRTDILSAWSSSPWPTSGAPPPEGPTWLTSIYITISPEGLSDAQRTQGHMAIRRDAGEECQISALVP